MKKILDFKSFHLLKEEAAVDLGGDSAAEPAAAPESGEQKKKTEETPKRNSAVVLKELMGEIRSNFIYWFSFGELSKILTAEASDMTYETRGLCIWATESDARGDEKYLWRIKVLEGEQEGMVERIERVMITFDVYDQNKEYLISSEERDIELTRLNDDYVVSKIKNIKGKIIKKPTDQKDVDKFKDGQEDRLSDDIY
jgi:hypothetical protein